MSGTYSLNARQLAEAPPAPGLAACTDVDPELFFPEASDLAHRPNSAERAALAVCAVCPVQDWCLERDMEECSTETRVRGVRGGLRQADRRALHVARFGRRPRNGAGAVSGE
ncbi:WhiB family transcriptional regulator [Streptomyces sp. NPDC002526]